jgi:hypothetical protein
VSREFKFRAWDIAEKKMLTSLEVMRFGASESNVEQVYGYNPSREASSDGRWVSLNNLVVMQYIGLKDVKKVEIYEGDIIRFTSPRERGTKRTHRPFVDMVIEWREDKARFGARILNPSVKSIPRSYGHLPTMVIDPNHARIGNIYENPELLEAK